MNNICNDIFLRFNVVTKQNGYDSVGDFVQRGIGRVSDLIYKLEKGLR